MAGLSSTWSTRCLESARLSRWETDASPYTSTLPGESRYPSTRYGVMPLDQVTCRPPSDGQYSPANQTITPLNIQHLRLPGESIHNSQWHCMNLFIAYHRESYVVCVCGSEGRWAGFVSNRSTSPVVGPSGAASKTVGTEWSYFLAAAIMRPTRLAWRLLIR